MIASKKRPIKFNFHPYKFSEDRRFYVEKEEEGIKRKYLVGIASGLKVDGQGERMTKNCINNMHKQVNSGDLLIFDSPHGVAGTDDIGIIIKSEVTPLGDWVIEARLYDVLDGFREDSITLQKISKLWKQLRGIKPYRKPAKKGFSVEGYIPDGGIKSMTDDGKRTVDDIVLKGAIVTSIPAYRDSVITAVHKALDELIPEEKKALKKSVFDKLSDKLNSGDAGQNFYLQYYGIQDLFQDILEEVLRNPQKLDDRLNTVFEPYKRIVSELLKRNINMFLNTDATDRALRKENRVRMAFLKFSELYLIRKTKRNKEKSYGCNANDSKIVGNNSKTTARRRRTNGT